MGFINKHFLWWSISDCILMYAFIKISGGCVVWNPVMVIMQTCMKSFCTWQPRLVVCCMTNQLSRIISSTFGSGPYFEPSWVCTICTKCLIWYWDSITWNLSQFKWYSGYIFQYRYLEMCEVLDLVALIYAVFYCSMPILLLPRPFSLCHHVLLCLSVLMLS